MSGYQAMLFPQDSGWVAPAISSLPSWANAKRVAIDLETYDPDLSTMGPGVRRGGYIAGIAFAVEDGQSFYLPIAHQGGGNMNRENVLAYLREQASVFAGDICGANLLYDLDFLAEVGIEFHAKWFRDVQVAEPLLDELQHHYNLESIATRHGMPGKDTADLKAAAQEHGGGSNWAGTIWKLPAGLVAKYAIRDCTLPLGLLRRQERRIDEEELWEIYNLESRLIPVLLRMRRRGVRISHDRLDQVEKWSMGEEAAALELIRQKTGVRVGMGEVWGQEPFAGILRSIGIKIPKTQSKDKKTGRVVSKISITSDYLEGLSHPVPQAMARARRVNKVRSTFVKSIRNYAVGDRVHCCFNQLRREKEEGGLAGAAYGRMSSEHPNLQQQPARDPEIGPMWRAIYIPEGDGQWACLDYSQQEPRLLLHYAEIIGCTGATAAATKYREDPTTDMHQMIADLTGLPRKTSKQIYLGYCYGMGPAKLAHSLDLPTKVVFSERKQKEIEVAGDEATEVFETFNRRAPYVKQLQKKCEDTAKNRGYITTLLGRRCRFPISKKGGYDLTHKALNRLIQGGSADQMKAAMIAADAAGFPLAIQVHDELDLTSYSPDETKELAHIMATAVTLRVPSKVDIEIGPSWGEIK